MQGNEELKKRQMLSAQIDLSKFNKGDFIKATEEEKKQQDVMGESTTFFKDGMKRLKKNPLAMGSIVILVLILALIIIAPFFVPYSYSDIITVDGKRDKTAANMAPFEYSKLEQQYMDRTGEKLFPHIFGTDNLSRDYFIRVIYGTRVSLSVGVIAAIMVLIIGLVYGSVAGYFGGKVDLIMMRIVDILSGIPSLIYLILIMMFLGSSVQSILLAMCLTYWITTARMVRGQIFTLREQDYALAAKVCGQTKWQILIHHLIPNSMGSIIVTMTFLIPSAIFEEAFLSFLGIGIQVPKASWGTMCNDAIQYLTQQPWLMIFPALAISITIFSLNFIGDGLRDALDPRINKQ